MTSRFDSDDIYYRVMDSQLMYQSGYLAGRKEMKKEIILELEKLAKKSFDNDLSKYSLYTEMQETISKMTL